jgi:hypothetical protein
MRYSVAIFLNLVFLGMLSTLADACVLSGGSYRLVSDTVRWSLELGSGESCIRGVRFNDMVVDTLTVVSTPQNGQVTLYGLGFTYKAWSDFQGQDSFSLLVSGSTNKVPGSSTIDVVVSVSRANELRQLATMNPCSRADLATPGSTGSATIDQEFNPWIGKTSPDGIWRINGFWKGSGGNILDPALAKLSSSYNDQSSGFLSLTVKANELRGSEIQTVTLPGCSYGYYETNMKVTSVPGVVASFFWVEAPNYGPREWDIEFLTNESWINSNNSGKVHLFIHPSNVTHILDLPFNPSLAFHRYGFLWTAGSISFTVDGQFAYRFVDTSLNTTAHGFIVMNTWTGNPNWGGGPPAKDATTIYDWVHFYPDVSSVPTSH